MFDLLMFKYMTFIQNMNIRMSERIQCPNCNKRLSGEGHLRRHIQTVHKSKHSE